MRGTEGSRSAHKCPRTILPAVRRAQEKDRLRALDLLHADARADGEIEPERVALEVGNDLVARRITLGVSGERQAGQARVAGRREEGQAVVVSRPRTSGLQAGFDDDEA